MGQATETDPEQLTLAQIDNLAPPGPTGVGIAVGTTRSGVLDSLETLLREHAEWRGDGDPDYHAVAEYVLDNCASPAPGNTGYVAHQVDRDKAWNDVRRVIDEVDNVVVVDLADLGETPGVILTRVAEAFDKGVAVKIVSQDREVEPDSESSESMLATLASLDRSGVQLHRETERRDIRDRIESIDYSGGRPPFGFEVKNGELTPVDGFDEICSVLSLVDDGKLSRRKAADKLGCSERTIQRALEEPDRREWYGLPVDK